ncbi:TetR/AcrR family transcriptional regulator [Kitasatospora sp. NPDC098663]|uniref:TetR/AcrR family transcriptional regulator n=1 Tax=Kitasatospora sp. NPDC098663 TaxID=3364096 RepID=UPI00382DCBC1
MGASDVRTPRERYRAQVQEEIKERAWEQIATAGASALSLNAIAKRMGMSGPALYRYFASRDELITELVRDAYRSLADAFRARAAAGADVAGLAQALRRWALDDPQRYLLVYGTPVPGYRAPEDTTRISVEIMAVLLDACAAEPSLVEQPPVEQPPAERSPAVPPSPFDAHLAEHRAWAGEHPAPPAVLHLALAVWTRLHGVLSLELAGHFAGMGFDPAELYAAELRSLTGR